MSILQEYEEIRESMSEKEYEDINKFLDLHPDYLLSDVYYNQEVYEKFEIWQNRQELNHLNYYVEGLNRRNPFINVTLDDMMEELVKNPKLKEHVLTFAKKELHENNLMDKHYTIRAIESGCTEFLFNHDTEVRENFCECFIGGINTRKEELREERKQFKAKHEKEQSR